MTGCNILNNIPYAIYAASGDDPVTVIDATGNWWGVTDSTAIEDMIFHNLDSSLFPVVDYVPFSESRIDTSSVGIADNPENMLPDGFALNQNYPNPFNPETVIEFSLPGRCSVSLIVYNLLGRQVKKLVEGELSAGNHTISWDGTDNSGSEVSTGIYLYRLQTTDYVESRKMILMK